MKFSVGTVLAATLALTYPVQARNAPLNGRDPVAAVNEAKGSQDNVAPHKEAVTKLIWIRDGASMTATPSAHPNPIFRHPKAPTQLPQPSEAPNEGHPSKQPSATINEGDQGTESTGSPNHDLNQSSPSETPSPPSNTPEPSVIPISRSNTPTSSGIPHPSQPGSSEAPYPPSNTPEPSVIPISRSNTPTSSGIPHPNQQGSSETPSHPSNTPEPSGIPNPSQPGSSEAPSPPSNTPEPSVIPISRSSAPSPLGIPHPSQPNFSETPTTHSPELGASKPVGSSETNTPLTPSQEGIGSDSATPSKMPEQTGSPSATPTRASSNSDSTIQSSMMTATTSGHTTTEAVLVPVTTVKITKGHETSSVTFTATSVTTSEGSKPTIAWGCASSDLCGSGTTDSGGSSGGCVVPLLCPSDHNWGIGGGWSPSGNPSPGGPSPPPSTPETPSGSGSEEPDDDPEDDNTTTSATTTDKTTSSTTSATSSTTSPSSSKLRLCMTVVESGTVVSTQTPTTSSKATTSATSTPTSASKLRLCMTVVESGSVTTTSEAATTSEATTTSKATTTSDKKSNTITSAPKTFTTTTKSPEGSLCRIRQDPHGPSSCICTAGATETWLPTQSKYGGCGYSTLPTPTETATTDDQPPPTLGPVTSTTTNDELIIWPTQTIKYIEAGLGTMLTETYPAGEPTTSTITADTPEVTGWNPKGSSICGTTIGDGLNPHCEAAWANYDDDTVYTEKTKRHDSNSLGMGCIAEYACSEEYGHYTPGLTGTQLKGLFAAIYETKGNGIGTCGFAELSSNCTVTLNYCASCKDVN